MEGQNKLSQGTFDGRLRSKLFWSCVCSELVKLNFPMGIDYV